MDFACSFRTCVASSKCSGVKTCGLGYLATQHCPYECELLFVSVVSPVIDYQPAQGVHTTSAGIGSSFRMTLK